MRKHTGTSNLGSHYDKAASWLLDSFDANDGFGSSAWRSRALHPVRGWSFPYPETTGYIIPTLYDLAALCPERSTHASMCISRSVRWLLSLQLPSGAFPGGHAVRHDAYYLSTSDYLRRRSRRPTPSVFNSGQILRGLEREYRETGDRLALEALRRCARYLADSVADDGRWCIDAYAGSSSPSYFTYVTSALLSARELLHGGQEIESRCRLNLERVLSSVSARDGFIGGMGFGGSNRAHTHTVGYTLSGLLDSSQYLDEGREGCLDVALRALDRIAASLDDRGALPGGYSDGWSEDTSYTCVTGNIQMALCFLTAHRITGIDSYSAIAARLHEGATACQRGDGGFPGSVPATGDYMRLRSPNWAVKYYMDLSVALRKTPGLEACGRGRDPR